MGEGHGCLSINLLSPFLLDLLPLPGLEKEEWERWRNGGKRKCGGKANVHWRGGGAGTLLGKGAAFCMLPQVSERASFSGKNGRTVGEMTNGLPPCNACGQSWRNSCRYWCCSSGVGTQSIRWCFSSSYYVKKGKKKSCSTLEPVLGLRLVDLLGMNGLSIVALEHLHLIL